MCAVLAQLVEHIIGKDEVGSSSLLNSSRNGYHFVVSVFCLSEQ